MVVTGWIVFLLHGLYFTHPDYKLNTYTCTFFLQKGIVFVFDFIYVSMYRMIHCCFTVPYIHSALALSLIMITACTYVYTALSVTSESN